MSIDSLLCTLIKQERSQGEGGVEQKARINTRRAWGNN